MTDTSKLAGRTAIAAVATVVGLALAGVGIWTQRPQLAPVEVSQQTTYIITPTRPDGWVDYPEAVDWMRRASLDAGGANAAIPLLKALGQAVLPVGVDRGEILKRLGITAAGDEASVLKPLREFAAADGAGGKEPAPAAMEWLRARCPAKEQASFARIGAWLAATDGALMAMAPASLTAMPLPAKKALPGVFTAAGPVND